jgi:hypothetical protein
MMSVKQPAGNRSIQRKPAPVLLCPPQIPHDMTWARTQATTYLISKIVPSTKRAEIKLDSNFLDTMLR